MIDLAAIKNMRGADVLKTAAELLHDRAETIRQSNDAAVAAGYYPEWAPETKAQYGAIMGAAQYFRQTLEDGRQMMSANKQPPKHIVALIEFLRSALINELMPVSSECDHDA